MWSKEKLERAKSKYEQKNRKYQEWIKEEEKLEKELEAKKRALMASYDKKKKSAKEKGKRLKAQMEKALAPMRELNISRLMELDPNFGVTQVTVGAVRVFSAYNKVSRELAGDKEISISVEEIENLFRDFIRQKIENGDFLETNQDTMDKKVEKKPVQNDNNMEISVDMHLVNANDGNEKDKVSKGDESYYYNSSTTEELIEESINLKEGEIIDVKTVGEKEQKTRIEDEVSLKAKVDEVFDLQEEHHEERPKFENLGFVPRPFKR